MLERFAILSVLSDVYQLLSLHMSTGLLENELYLNFYL